MTWLSLDEAVEQVVRCANLKGAHVFYSRKKDKFEVVNRSQNHSYINEKLQISSNNYCGFFKSGRDFNINHITEVLSHEQESRKS